jgi:hypothetical protein
VAILLELVSIALWSHLAYRTADASSSTLPSGQKVDVGNLTDDQILSVLNSCPDWLCFSKKTSLATRALVVAHLKPVMSIESSRARRLLLVFLSKPKPTNPDDSLWHRFGTATVFNRMFFRIDPKTKLSNLGCWEAIRSNDLTSSEFALWPLSLANGRVLLTGNPGDYGPIYAFGKEFDAFRSKFPRRKW